MRAFALTFLAALVPAALADDLLVPAEHATIQDAINAAAAGDVVLVSPGTYNEPLDTLGKAITLASTEGASTTILDGDGFIDSILTIFTNEGADTVVTGFTFTGGTGKQILGPATPWYTQGGGIYLENSAPTIADCVFDDNSALFGAGIMCQGDTAPVVTDCVFRNGYAFHENGGSGGGVHLVDETAVGTFERCLFEDNFGRQGGAVWVKASPSTFTDCDFIGNVAPVVAGAVQVAGNSNDQGLRPRFDRCRFLRNHAGDGSGFAGNGGAIEFFSRGAEINDSLFAGNTCDSFGPHIAHLIDSVSVITNCTFLGNGTTTQPILSSQSDLQLVNCIVWDPSLPIFLSSTTAATSCIIGGIAETNGNLPGDPLFADPLGPDGIAGTDDDDFTLLPGSPAIDSGDTTARPAGADLDLVGNPRLSDDPDTADTGVGTAPIVDRGAFEVQGPASTCFADCDANGSLNVDDIDCFVAAFLTADLAGADCDANGSLNVDDIDCFVASFLGGCP
ncbi:MAG: hypothetical protein DHS20C14_04130 [Phycisphaeraceae bacterium]|nr:MAG: hypothetical protein DHS20C14_04130 [Phycisphaeraceae bacterium]